MCGKGERGGGDKLIVVGDDVVVEPAGRVQECHV